MKVQKFEIQGNSDHKPMQDATAVGCLGEEAGVVVVCDGVSSEIGTEEGSAFCARVVCDAVLDAIRWNVSVDNVLREGGYVACRLAAASELRGWHEWLYTTIVVGVIRQERVEVWRLGDGGAVARVKGQEVMMPDPLGNVVYEHAVSLARTSGIWTGQLTFREVSAGFTKIISLEGEAEMVAVWTDGLKYYPDVEKALASAPVGDDIAARFWELASEEEAGPASITKSQRRHGYVDDLAVALAWR
jgi:hypothetical protein